MADKEHAGTILARAHGIHIKMAHVIQQRVQYYCMYEVLKGSWQRLEAELCHAEDLGALLSLPPAAATSTASLTGRCAV